MKKKYLVAQINDVRFYAKHQVLRELILLISKQAEVFVHQRINIFVGIHHWIANALPSKALNVGIQTEQFYDAYGLKLWGSLPENHLKAACLKFDVILDFSEFNKPAYKNFDKYNRVVFGPYIFPSKKIIHKKENASEVHFVGALNERRQKIISDISKLYTIKVIKNEFGEKLNKTLSGSAGILNIHFQNGVYTEWPRILLAYANGKILISEELAYPLISGRHYYPLGSELNEMNSSQIHENTWQDFAGKYSFSEFINSEKFEKINILLSEKIFLMQQIFILRAENLLRNFSIK